MLSHTSNLQHSSSIKLLAITLNWFELQKKIHKQVISKTVLSLIITFRLVVHNQLYKATLNYNQ